MAQEILRTAGNSWTPACVLTLSVASDIEYRLTYHPLTTPQEEHQILIRARRGSLDALVGFLERTETVEGADEARLAAASRSEVEREDLGRYGLWSIRDAIQRWLHKAGASNEWINVQGGRQQRVTREHIFLKTPQAGTARSIMFSLDFWTRGDEEDRFTFEEQYRAPEELLGYSYATGMPYAELPTLAGYLADLLDLADRPGDSEELLIRCLEQLIARGDLDPAAGQATARDQVDRWRTVAGVARAYGHNGDDRRETLLEVPLDGDRLLSLSFSIDAYSKELHFQEGYGSADNRWRDALYQLHIPYSSAGTLLTWLETRLGERADHLSVDDRLVGCFQALAARGDLAPGRPMAVRDRFAGWLTAAGVEFKSWGADWKETLLSVHREKTDCIFTLTLTLDPEDATKGLRFAEHYDYLPSKGDAGREYAYSVHTPYSSVEVLAEFFEKRLGQSTDGTPGDRLIASFATLVALGELAGGLPLEENQLRVAGWFEEAGVPAEPEKSSWFNSD
jgi:hypothetical protein